MPATSIDACPSPRAIRPRSTRGMRTRRVAAVALLALTFTGAATATAQAPSASADPISVHHSASR